MAFICEPCHTREDLCPVVFADHLANSRGTCETCHKVADCQDCRVHHQANFEELRRARFGRQYLCISCHTDSIPCELEFSLHDDIKTGMCQGCGNKTTDVLKCVGLKAPIAAPKSDEPPNDNSFGCPMCGEMLGAEHGQQHYKGKCAECAIGLQGLLIQQLVYLWTRDAGVKPEDVQKYVAERMVEPSGINVSYTNEARILQAKKIIRLLGWEY